MIKKTKSKSHSGLTYQDSKWTSLTMTSYLSLKKEYSMSQAAPKKASKSTSTTKKWTSKTSKTTATYK